MAKSPNQKMKLLYLAKYLSTQSDEEHPVSIADMAAYLKSIGIDAERKSLYDDIECLSLFGLDIVSVRGKQYKYFVASRDFDMPELKLLVDAVISAKFLSEKKSEELVKKMSALTSVYEAKQLQRTVYITNRLKTMNEKVYYSVDSIHRAISENKQLCFRYTEWKLNFGGRERIVRSERRGGGTYRISPCGLVWDDENYYLVGYDHDDEKIKHFRVDKIEGISVCDEARAEGEMFADFNAPDYMKKVFGMYGGEDTAVVLQFDNSLVGIVADRFGQGCSIRKHDENSFELSAKVEVSPQFFAFLFGYGDKVRVLGPDTLISAYGEFVKKVAALY